MQAQSLSDSLLSSNRAMKETYLHLDFLTQLNDGVRRSGQNRRVIHV